ncbi:RelA/SpoT domain-containing protein [Aquabacterium sp. J223]|uniref:RelA/SpoT domain-containing protein n=1 Tax=Aquabacterium sp. J223 TaxID=2898431 RepID=UPI0021ADD109|nr:RelA/SpoT domain-containing protein [Aquabacterium sp. J223]UUX94919.1 RelA/SpoT domain-containing protein [Aquabacterium sp. J223]
MSKSQVDRLGERLKQGTLSEDDLRLLDDYRRTASTAYDSVSERLRHFGFQVTGRPAKATQSIRAKLRREHCRLTQIQDIAGCRIVVGDARDQEMAAARIEQIFPGCRKHDRRVAPSFGYRAIHFVTADQPLPVEIQLRTALQHQWAEFSEKLSDRYGLEVKYGGGSESLKERLMGASILVAQIEAVELYGDRSLVEQLRAMRNDLLNGLRTAAAELDKEQ